MAAVLCFSLGYAQESPRSSGAGKQAGGTQTSSAKSVLEAERELFGKADEADYFDGYTSHFNFDNRAFGQNPPTTNKLRCQVECKLDNGHTRWFTNGDLWRVYVGDLDLVDVNSNRVRVVQCRFWWKLRPLGDWYSSEWAKARPDHYIVYAFLVWRGHNDYEKPIYFYDEPLADGMSRAKTAEPEAAPPAKKP
jgi:hypothetical protein